jgi:23S rRNA (guanine2445-N2)-methyltransferase / 23S rRNA (guanine2069-N7)-methyltransferase
MKSSLLELFAPCPKGLEYLLRDELVALGASDVREVLAGVKCRGDFALAMKLCLHSRLASRIAIVISRFDLADADDLYEAAKVLDWVDWFRPTSEASQKLSGGLHTFAIDVSGSAPGIAHTGFAGLRVKDAIVDQHRERGVDRPSVDVDNPSIRIRVYLHPKESAIMWDLCGNALHERGWRTGQGEAPIKENLAAALLIRAKWPERAGRGEAFIDPMCGAGTILMEAIAMAADVPAGLKRAERGEFAYQSHPQYKKITEDALLAAAKAQAQAGLQRIGQQALSSGAQFIGVDSNSDLIGIAKRNLQVAGFAGYVRLILNDAASLKRPEHIQAGLLLCNPPYGERMGDARSLAPVYRALGAMLGSEFNGFAAAMISSDPELLHAVNLPITKRYALKNGALDCTLAIFDTTRYKAKALATEESLGAEDAVESAAPAGLLGGARLSAAAQMVANRIDKNRRRLKSYLLDQQLQCYRVYDADLPEYCAAIDVYGERLHIQEYLAPIEIPEATATARLRELVMGAQHAFELPRESIYLKTRKRDKGGSKYQREKQRTDDYFETREGEHRFWVNLEDFLDSGLFLDSRMLRQRIQKSASGKRFLNLFCYTASASVYAAAGGASYSLSIDLSPTYTNWAQQNFELNNMDPNIHEIEQADVVQWLEWAHTQEDAKGAFDLIYLDPPTFSNSKRTESVLDILEDHGLLIAQCMELLSVEGQLLFVTNAQKFKINQELMTEFDVQDISAKTLPPDFERNPKIHRAFQIRHKSS